MMIKDKLSNGSFYRSFLVGVGAGLGAASIFAGILSGVCWFFGELLLFVFSGNETN